MELIKVTDRTFYIKNNTNIGVYKVNDNDVYIIDCGNDEDAGKKILRILDENGLNVIGVINTHSNADHVGGNKVIQSRTNCNIYSNKIETCISNYPILEPSFLYGGYPFKQLRNKFLMAKPSFVQDIPSIDGLEVIDLKGHFFDMIGIKTSDDVYFLGDSLFSEDTINKYHVFFIYDVNGYLNTLDYLDTLNGKLFIPSHCEAIEDIHPLVETNRNLIYDVLESIKNYCSENRTFEDILKYVFDKYNLTMNENQYVLVGSSIKSYLSYLSDNDMIHYSFIDNRMYWVK